MVEKTKEEEILDNLEDCSNMRETLKISEKVCGASFIAYLGLVFYNTLKDDNNFLSNISESKGIFIAIVLAALCTYGMRKQYEKKTIKEKKKFNDLAGEEIFDEQNPNLDYYVLRKQRKKQSNYNF